MHHVLNHHSAVKLDTHCQKLFFYTALHCTKITRSVYI
jgi:hypothetical protein